MASNHHLRYVGFSLLLMIGAMSTHYWLSDRVVSHRVMGVVVTTGLSQPSLGVAWYAPRMLVGSTAPTNPAYPELNPIRRSDFVYAH